MLSVAEEANLETAIRQQLRQVVVGSVGPTTSTALREAGLPVDFEAENPKMGSLVTTAARCAQELKERKEKVTVAMSRPENAPIDHESAWFSSPFMKACRGEPTDVTPVWLMRQAGRYMAEYRAVRAQTTFLELCKNPQLCSEVMTTAVERLGVDAAIIFSDLLPILEPMGFDLEYAKGEGPIIHNPLREPSDVDRVEELDSVDALYFVMETVKQTRSDLPPQIPLIGFAGAPFTLASYTIEGGSSRTYVTTKTLMYRDEGAWRALMERFARAVIRYLNAQILAGAQCVQLFDSWAGCLSVQDYERYVFPYVQQIVANLTADVPVINFATGNPALLPALADAGKVVVGVDWRIGLAEARRLVGSDRPVQGNLDPAVLLANPEEIRAGVRRVLDEAGPSPGHIFNLGHGVLQQTPVEHAIALVDAVHELSSK
jgi:uroporphyrinogen decarboxylase